MLDRIFSKLRISRLKWHDLRDVKPVSSKFGTDRGTPIDRYYIEKFLDANRKTITGTVLEVAESRYSKKFGRNVASHEVLHVHNHPSATLVGDLSKPETLPSSIIDCFICTQVYNFIFDFQKAIEGTYRLLKPGGVVLATVSGISQVSRFDADRWGHFWSFYPQGIRQAFADVFGNNSVEVETYGNSLAAICFIKGIAREEINVTELDFYDEDFPVTITIRATKS